MNKTLYIRDEDEPIWKRAQELAGAKGLSSLLVASLKRFVQDREAKESEGKGFERITVSFNDSDEHGIPKIKAFHGRWIIPRDNPLRAGSEHGDRVWTYSVAITRKGAAVVLWTESDEYGDSQHFRTFPSLEAAAADRNTNCAARAAIEAIGVPVEELDI